MLLHKHDLEDVRSNERPDEFSPKGKTAVNSLDTPSRISPDYTLNGILPDHAEAFAGILEKAAREIRLNRSAEDVANELLPIVRVATRRT